MTETEVKLSQLKQSIPHLSSISEDGWVLKWGSDSEAAFEVVCRKTNALQMARLESVLNDGYRKALEELK